MVLVSTAAAWAALGTEAERVACGSHTGNVEPWCTAPFVPPLRWIGPSGFGPPLGRYDPSGRPRTEKLQYDPITGLLRGHIIRTGQRLWCSDLEYECYNARCLHNDQGLRNIAVLVVAQLLNVYSSLRTGAQTAAAARCSLAHLCARCSERRVDCGGC